MSCINEINKLATTHVLNNARNYDRNKTSTINVQYYMWTKINNLMVVF